MKTGGARPSDDEAAARTERDGNDHDRAGWHRMRRASTGMSRAAIPLAGRQRVLRTRRRILRAVLVRVRSGRATPRVRSRCCGLRGTPTRTSANRGACTSSQPGNRIGSSPPAQARDSPTASMRYVAPRTSEKRLTTEAYPPRSGAPASARGNPWRDRGRRAPLPRTQRRASRPRHVRERVRANVTRPPVFVRCSDAGRLRGVAPDGIELHPVLSFKATSMCSGR